MLQYRTFWNFDPPELVKVWNEALTGRGAVRLSNSAPLERYVFAKPYFDPAGFIVAMDDDKYVGFVHAGFGPNNNESALSAASGSTCVICVRPSYQGRGIGAELLNRSESYLRGKGARTIYAGSMNPCNAFYLGLYGGSDLPGFLTSDEASAPFFEYHGYRPSTTCFVFNRRLEKAVNIVDGRFAGLRKKYAVRVAAKTGVASWWQECVLGPIELTEFRLEETATNRVVGRAEIWEMEGFSWRWGVPSAGIHSLQIREDLRRQGMGKFLITHVVKHLQEQYFGLIEAHAMERNQSAVKLLKVAGFEQVDFGRMYKLER